LKHKKRDTGHEDWTPISIVIVNLNGRRWLEKCLKSVMESDYPQDKLEVILVDNGSTDGSIEFVKEAWKDPRIKIIQNKENLGWSPANNQGMKVAKGEIIVCLSNDMEVDSRWLKEIVKLIKRDPRIGIVQCNSISMWDRKTIDSGMNFLDKYGFAYSYSPQERPWQVFFAEGMAFAIRNHVFREIGGFDDYYFMEYDDMDLCWRTRLAGYEVFFSPASIVYHARGGTVGSTYFEKRVRNIVQYVRNHFVTLMKNYELKNLLRVLPVVLFIQFMKMLYFIKARNTRLVLATLKGISLVLKDMKLIMQKRREVQQEVRKVSDEMVLKFMHPFRPMLLRLFLAAQAKGQRFILNSYPPMRSN
jgi:GT2 family glycosyltransferase